MKQFIHLRNEYTLTRIAGQPYLLPYGQNIAAFRRGLKLNETSAFLWEQLLSGCDEQTLVERLGERYAATAEELPTLQPDIALFLEQLRNLEIIDPPAPSFLSPCDEPTELSIAELCVRLQLPQRLISEELLSFAVKAGKRAADLTVSVRQGEPAVHPTGQLLIHNHELCVIDCESCYCLLFPASAELLSCQISKDCRQACYYCQDLDSPALREELFHGIRFAFLLCAQQHGRFAVHSASILYDQQAWLFSASSGTGKSTHAALWEQAYRTPLLNGDLNLLGMENGAPVVYGLPWCGTSGVYTTKTHPLGGVIFLQQHPTDVIVPLSADKRQLMLAQRMISPTWTHAQLMTCLDFCAQVDPHIVSFLLQCTPTPHAAAICRDAIDHKGAHL